jgi:hypothetical protein
MASSVKDVYWYNFSPHVISFAGNTVKQSSYLEVVCDTSFHGTLELEAAFENTATTYRKTVEFDENVKKSVIQEDLFSYFFEVPQFTLPPTTLALKDKSGNIIKTAECQYFKLEGFVKTEYPHEKLYIGIIPNGFNDPDLSQQVQPDGYYSLLLPQRHYNAFYAVADSYAKYTLENWTYNIDGKKDMALNFNIFNAEIYNLHVWENNGGGNSLFIVFRPMFLQNTLNDEISINNEVFSEINFGISLGKENIKVSIDNENLNILSVQSFYETDSKSNAIKSCIVQTEYDKRFRNKLLTVEIRHNDFIGTSQIFLGK